MPTEFLKKFGLRLIIVERQSEWRRRDLRWELKTSSRCLWINTILAPHTLAHTTFLNLLYTHMRIWLYKGGKQKETKVLHRISSFISSSWALEAHNGWEASGSGFWISVDCNWPYEEWRCEWIQDPTKLQEKKGKESRLCCLFLLHKIVSQVFFCFSPSHTFVLLMLYIFCI